jgi:hypothetical protein
MENSVVRPGTVLEHDARSSLFLPVYKGFRVIVTALWHNCADSLLVHQRDKLVELGFNYDAAAVEPALAADTLPFQVPSTTLTRTCIELCCSANSKIGANTLLSAGCKKIRFTERHDLTTDFGVNLAIETVKIAQRSNKGKVMLWIAIPCTGGCPWHRLNKRFPSAVLKIAKSKTLFEKLWENCMKVVKFALNAGGAMIAIEWP